MIISHYNAVDLRDHYIPKERQDFLANAERSPIGLGRLVEYIRTLEAAFNADGQTLVRLVHKFLSSSPAFQSDAKYSEGEIKNWKKIRDNLSHAGYTKNWVPERVSWQVLPRLRQAAFDVVISKRNWNKKDLERNSSISMNCYTKSDDGILFIKDTGKIKLSPFTYDRVGISYHNGYWLKAVAQSLNTERIDYLRPILEKFSDLELNVN